MRERNRFPAQDLSAIIHFFFQSKGATLTNKKVLEGSKVLSAEVRAWRNEEKKNNKT